MTDIRISSGAIAELIAGLPVEGQGWNLGVSKPALVAQLADYFVERDPLFRRDLFILRCFGVRVSDDDPARAPLPEWLLQRGQLADWGDEPILPP